MELKQVRCLLAVVEHGSFRRAATAIPLAQAAVSNHVAKLERELGVVVLERGAGGAHLTPAGEALLPGLRRLLADADDVSQSALDLRTGTGGRVRLAAIEAAIPGLVAPVLRLLGETTSIIVEVRESTPGQIDELLAQGEIDLALSARPGRQPPPGDARLIIGDRMAIAARRDGSHAEGGAFTREDVTGHRLIVLDRGLLRQLSDNYFLGRDLAEAVVVSHHGTALDLAASGVGLTLTPTVSLGRHPELTAVPITDAQLDARLWMIVSSRATPATSTVVAAIESTVASLFGTIGSADVQRRRESRV